MNIAVFSDSHGTSAGMIQIIEKYQPDAVIHCGDGYSDTKAIEKRFPEIPLYRVAGNCDWCKDVPYKMTIELGGIKIFITHGHMYSVKSGSLDRLIYAAEEEGATLCLYGHTHSAGYDFIGSVTAINPGSIGYGNNFNGDQTWCLLNISGGEANWRISKLYD